MTTCKYPNFIFTHYHLLILLFSYFIFFLYFSNLTSSDSTLAFIYLFICLIYLVCLYLWHTFTSFLYLYINYFFGPFITLCVLKFWPHFITFLLSSVIFLFSYFLNLLFISLSLYLFLTNPLQLLLTQISPSLFYSLLFLLGGAIIRGDQSRPEKKKRNDRHMKGLDRKQGGRRGLNTKANFISHWPDSLLSLASLSSRAKGNITHSLAMLPTLKSSLRVSLKGAEAIITQIVSARKE